MRDMYILNGHEPVKVDPSDWASWFDVPIRHVALDKFDGIEVSTVFLGIDHDWTGLRPLLFETMVFGGEYDEWQERYGTWGEAEQGHKEIVERLKGGFCPTRDEP